MSMTVSTNLDRLQHVRHSGDLKRLTGTRWVGLDFEGFELAVREGMVREKALRRGG